MDDNDNTKVFFQLSRVIPDGGCKKDQKLALRRKCTDSCTTKGKGKKEHGTSSSSYSRVDEKERILQSCLSS